MFEVTECKNVIKNFFTEPEYKELHITKLAFLKVMTFAHMAGKYEISGFGRIKDDVIVDFKILKQEVRNAYVECTDDAMQEFIRSVPKEELNEWNLDWHSHVDMSAFASGTDTDNYNDMLNLRMGKQFPAMIVNKSGDIKLFNFISEKRMIDIDLFYADDEPTDEEINQMYEQCEKEVKENLTVYVAPVTEIKTYNANKGNTYWQAKQYRWNVDNDYDNQDQFDDYKVYYCKSCGLALETDEEIKRGICDDCAEVINNMIY